MEASLQPLRILTLHAHPDDESFGPAAELALYARRGAEIHGVFATRGEHGQTDVQPEPSAQELGRLREQDLREVTALIGYRQIEVLDYEDGSLDKVAQPELERHFWAAVVRYRPHVLITFGPGGITRHPDHVAVHRAAVAVFERARQGNLGVRELYYDAISPESARERGIDGLPDGQPNTWIDVSSTHEIKLQALRLHGRHVVDARRRADQLEQAPQRVATLHRAWPPVAGGEQVSGFLSGS